MEPRRPELRDFGVSEREYRLYTGARSNVDEVDGQLLGVTYFVVVLIVVSVAFFVTRSWGTTIGWGIGAVFCFPITGAIAFGISTLIQPVCTWFQRNRMLVSDVPHKIRNYDEAVKVYLDAYGQWEESECQRKEHERQVREAEQRQRDVLRRQQRKREQFWQSLDGIEFEQEVAALCRAMSYYVETTPRTGDQGIDLILKQRGKTTIVQCKAHKNPVGPAVVRELYGSMYDYGADSAVLARSGGFTKGVLNFAQDKKITLLDAPELARLAVQYGHEIKQMPETSPTCPKCERSMVLRYGNRGAFWGCPTFPTCRGTRAV